MAPQTLREKYGQIGASTPDNFIVSLFQQRTQLHIYHLQTSGNIHSYLQEFYEILLEYTDTIAEVYGGKYQPIKINNSVTTTSFNNYSTLVNLITYIEKNIINYIDSSSSLFEKDREIQNLLDELMGHLYQKLNKLKGLEKNAV
jgi:hypothetical protein